MIPITNFKKQIDHLEHEIFSVIQRVLRSGWYILGKEGQQFEENFAAYIGTGYCVGVASGTDAITLSLMALDIGPGSEVITTAMTAFPTIVGIMRAGATPILVDINISDGLMDVEHLKGKITAKTKAIIPVHLYGQSCDMRPIAQIAQEEGLKIIEDCAQSVGATYEKAKTGSLGDCGTFSFYPTKNLGAYGDGGAIVTNNEDIYQTLLKLRNYGQEDRYHHDLYGLNSRLDEIQAALLNVKLKYLDQWNRSRRQVAARYQEGLKGVRCLRENSYGEPVYHLFVIRSKNRETLQQVLSQKGIQTLIHYPVPIHRHGAFPGDGSVLSLPHADTFASEILSIPIYPELEKSEVETIIMVINEFSA
ncbi:DegT/DnrJ/EryC1/StrS family aminotransferase [candidate division CSSED10-310 bacterium]|uniref:DegT/DnrJ/EryC1/StrS family aminotransferase n=1 Tax=candidate division CSSED10-310 bacterium TaxID=2855610 RepID=A0ABV6YYR8_UNCC1